MQLFFFILQIMKEYISCYEKPRILGLTAPLLNSACDPGRLEGEIRRLEMVLHSTAETASDIVSVLRYSMTVPVIQHHHQYNLN
jgi:endoribonuclease Dicer